MAEFEFKVKGRGSGFTFKGPTIEVLRKIGQSPADFQRAKRAAMYQVGQDVVRFVQTGMEREKKTGRVYRVRKGNRIVNHRASAAGEFPAIITGTLIKSFDFLVRGNQIEVGSTDPKSHFLEFGTKNKDGSEKMAPRRPLDRAVKEREKVSFNFFDRMVLLGLTKP